MIRVSATGQRLQGILRSVSDSVFSLFTVNEKNTKGGFVGAFTAGLDAIEKMIAAVKVAITWGEALGKGFSKMIEPFKREFMPLIDALFESIGGDGGQTALWVFEKLGQLLGYLATAAMIPWLIISALGLAVVKLGEFLSWLWSLLPDWFTSLFGDGQTSTPAPAPALSGANNIVSAGPGQPNAARAVVSQPNVTVNIAPRTDGAMGADEIASAVGASIPGVVQTAADRASRTQ